MLRHVHLQVLDLFTYMCTKVCVDVDVTLVPQTCLTVAMVISGAVSAPAASLRSIAENVVSVETCPNMAVLVDRDRSASRGSAFDSRESSTQTTPCTTRRPSCKMRWWLN